MDHFENTYRTDPEKMGFYIPERRMEIYEIPTIITDPHAEVLPLWMEISDGPALLLHIDHHADMDKGAPTFEQAKKEYAYAKIENYRDYAKNCVSVAGFIGFAIHEKKVGSVFWFDPRSKNVTAYGRVKEGVFINAPATKINDKGRIEWDAEKNEPISESITAEDALQDMTSFDGPIILDVDLDAFLCTKDPVGQNPDIMLERLDKFQRLIESFGKKPTIISIARSQTPSLWTPPDKVNDIEQRVLAILKKVLK
jgi:hypothetical protein